MAHPSSGDRRCDHCRRDCGGGAGESATSRINPKWPGDRRSQVSQNQFDYGTHHYNEIVNASFQVRNVGDATLYVLGAPQIEVIEGCCPPGTQVSSKILHPGEEATVSFSFMMHQGMDGPHDFRVHVRTSDPEVPDQTVEVLSNWVP